MAGMLYSLVDCRGGKHTPGSETEALMNDDMHSKNKYANVIGNAGDTFNHNHFALTKTQPISFTCSHSHIDQSGSLRESKK